VTGNLTEIFDWYAGNVEISRQLSTKLRVGLNSRVTYRTRKTCCASMKAGKAHG
jgi:hypothetical protein